MRIPKRSRQPNLAESARESARQPDGRFGIQGRTEIDGLDLRHQSRLPDSGGRDFVLRTADVEPDLRALGNEAERFRLEVEPDLMATSPRGLDGGFGKGALLALAEDAGGEEPDSLDRSADRRSLRSAVVDDLARWEDLRAQPASEAICIVHWADGGDANDCDRCREIAATWTLARDCESAEEFAARNNAVARVQRHTLHGTWERPRISVVAIARSAEDCEGEYAALEAYNEWRCGGAYALVLTSRETGLSVRSGTLLASSNGDRQRNSLLGLLASRLDREAGSAAVT